MLTAYRIRERLNYDPETGMFTWKYPRIKTVAGTFKRKYVTIKLNRKNYPAHVLAWVYMTGKWPTVEIDHCNLLFQAQNQWNTGKQKDNKPGFKGVLRVEQPCGTTWRASVMANGVRHYLGSFDCPAGAFFARVVAAENLHGEFARHE